jgi:AraC-like DNA-binding protein
MADTADPGGLVHRAIYAAHLTSLVARWGVTPEQLLAGTGISPAALEDPDGTVAGEGMTRLILRALQLTGEPGLGYYQGLHVKLSAHGQVGLAAMTQATLEQAMQVAERYFPLRAQHLALRSHLEGEEAMLELVEQVPLGPVRGFWLEVMVTSFVQMGKALLGRPLVGRVELSIDEPAHFQGFAHLWPGPVRFGCPHNRLIFPRSLLSEPLQMADTFASEKALLECERELSTLGETSSLLASVRRQMMAMARGFPSASELARKRHVSLRTLKRHLAAHGTSFQQLLDELRRDRALALLEDPTQSIATIADLLGYADASNFNRAFRRWMGVAPTEWRESRAGRG